MKRKVDIDEILATFSSHVSRGYQSPGGLQATLDALLDKKRRRMSRGEYRDSLEKNLVFLSDVLMEGESLLDVFIRRGDRGGDPERLRRRLAEMEDRIRGTTDERHREAFADGTDGDFEGLRALKERDGEAYVERLEFEYRHLMTLKILLFEFLNVLAAVGGEHGLGPGTGAWKERIMSHIELTAHYYLGNIRIEDRDRA